MNANSGTFSQDGLYDKYETNFLNSRNDHVETLEAPLSPASPIALKM